jgi:L-lysine exporter family protein LysE/ArgO
MIGTQAAVFAQGFGLSAGLIVAIGAQNVFVLTEGARGRRPWLVASLCTASDVLLIALGVGGVGSLVAGNRAFSGWLALGGALFLLAYGLRALKSALRGGSMAPGDAEGPLTTRAILLTTLGVSLLNPHALLDTVVLIGGLAGRLGEAERLAFGLGAAAASACWFFSLSLGGRLLAPLLARRRVWRALDGLVCLTMWLLAAGVGREALAALRG